MGNAGYIDESIRPALDKETLKKISDETQGRYYDVKSSAEAAAAFIDIESGTEQGQIPFDLTPFFMTLGFVTLFFEWGLLNTRFRPLP